MKNTSIILLKELRSLKIECAQMQIVSVSVTRNFGTELRISIKISTCRYMYTDGGKSALYFPTSLLFIYYRAEFVVYQMNYRLYIFSDSLTPHTSFYSFIHSFFQ